MSQEHGLSDKTTAQTQIQIQIVTQLEVQLKKEKVRLQAMMKHLHPKTRSEQSEQSMASPEPKRFKADSPSPPLSLSNLPKMTVPELLKNQSGQQQAAVMTSLANPLAHLMSLAPSQHSMSPLAALTSVPGAGHHPAPPPHSPTSSLSSVSTPLRGTLHDKTGFGQAPPSFGHQSGDSHRRRVTHHDRGNPNLDPEEDLSKNRDFYRVQDVRPPYTYAALIRQVIFT